MGVGGHQGIDDGDTLAVVEQISMNTAAAGLTKTVNAGRDLHGCTSWLPDWEEFNAKA